MKRAVGIAWILKAVSAATVLLNMAGIVTAQQQPPVVTHPTTSRAQGTPRTGSSPYGSAAAAQTSVKVAAGTIAGYVYWDMSSAQYKLSSPCQGLTVNVSTISKSGGQVLTTTSNFTSMGPLTDLSSPGAPRYMLCSYSFHQIPVGEYLRVTAAVNAAAFLKAVSVQNPPDFEIFGGNCNNTPQSALSFILTGGEMVCGNNAFNINLKLYGSGSLSGIQPARSGPLLQNGSGTSTSGGALTLSGSPSGGATLPGGTLNLGNGSGGGATSSGGTLQLSGQQQNATGSTLLPSPRAASTPAEKNPSPVGTPSLRPASPPGAQVSSPGSKVPLNPQPLPPKTASPSILPMKLKPGPLNMSPVVKNALAAKNGAAITAQLQIQRQNADQEASQMKLGLRPQGSPGALNNRAATSRTTIQNTATAGSVGPAKTMSSGNMSVSSMAPSQFNDLPMLCAQDPTMRIVRVSGKSTPATFTPDTRFNFYTLAGCSFGDPGPNAKVYIYFQNTFHQDFKVQEWNDNAIKLQLDDNLSGILDQDNVTLVVQRADGKQAVKNAFKFYAARETRLLSKILQQDWSLQHFTTNDVSKLTSQYFSPSEHGASQGFPRGWSAAVSWTEPPPLQADEDVYTFRDLAPGFDTDSAAAAEIDIDCDNKRWMQRAGKFGLNWDDRGYLHVQWQGQACTEQMPGVMGTKGDTFYSSGANYVLNVWVTGPRGVDPWSGKSLTGLLH